MTKVIDFSDPYFNATQALLTKKGAGYDSLESLEGKTLGVQIGTTGQEYAKDNAPEGVELKVFEDLALLLEAVKSGSIDAAINDNTVLVGYAEQNPDTEMTVEFDTGEQYGFGVAEGESADLLDAVNKALAEAHEDGTYEKLFKKYFPTWTCPRTSADRPPPSTGGRHGHEPTQACAGVARDPVRHPRGLGRGGRPGGRLEDARRRTSSTRRSSRGCSPRCSRRR